MAGIRIALLGGSDATRASKRAVLEAHSNMQIVFDSDGFAVMPQDFKDINFDIAIIEQRLGSQTAFDFIKALQALAKLDETALGRILVASQFHEAELRVTAIEVGAVDCVFVSDGPSSLIEKVKQCSTGDTDFGIRELLPELVEQPISEVLFQQTSVALATLSDGEAKVLKAFCELNNETEIASQAAISKVKVRAILNKVQTLLLLDTRSQLLLHMYRLGALAL